MTSKKMMRTAALVFLAAVMIIAAGCAKEETPAAMSAAGDVEIPAGEDLPVYTMEDPGPWAGKEAEHVPTIAYEKTEAGLRVTVTVSHEMNPETPHFIMWIQLYDGGETLLGEKTLAAEDLKAEVVFDLNAVPGTLRAFERCNLHGLWKASVDVVLE